MNKVHLVQEYIMINISCFVQRLLPMLEGGSDLFTQGAPQVPTSSVYTIRPFIPSDKVRYITFFIHALFFKTLEIIGSAKCLVFT